jgi:hypothetical protein
MFREKKNHLPKRAEEKRKKKEGLKTFPGRLFVAGD